MVIYLIYILAKFFLLQETIFTHLIKSRNKIRNGVKTPKISFKGKGLNFLLVGFRNNNKNYLRWM